MDKAVTHETTHRPLALSIVIPVYNERKTIREIIRRVKAVPREKQIIIVDDYSSDGTRRILRELQSEPGIEVVLQPKNMGKGAALRTGFELAKNDIVIIQDADLEYDPKDYEMLVLPIEAGNADVVFGSRFLHGVRRVVYYWHSVGNKLLTTFSNLLTDLNLTDMETCYKAFKREIIQNIILESDRFGFEPEITAKVAKLGCTVYEVPINYFGRSYREGKKITWRDGLAALSHIIRFAFSRKPFVKDMEAVRRCLVEPPPAEDVGLETLEAFEGAKRYNGWICDRFKPYVGGAVLEIGAGIGSIAAEILTLPQVESYMATDLSADSLAILSDRLGDDERVATCVWNAAAAPPPELSGRRFDTIICSNVLEHIGDHEQALRHMRSLLTEEGRLLLLVPQGPAVFCGLDEDLGHFRRYTSASLRAVLESCGYEIERQIEHNFLGIVGWWWAGKVKKQRKLKVKQTSNFDKLVPFLRSVDAFLTPLTGGVSTIAVARPKAATALSGVQESAAPRAGNGHG